MQRRAPGCGLMLWTTSCEPVNARLSDALDGVAHDACCRGDPLAATSSEGISPGRHLFAACCRDIVPLGQVKSSFKYSIDDKRVLNFENVVTDDDNVKQVMGERGHVRPLRVPA